MKVVCLGERESKHGDINYILGTLTGTETGKPGAYLIFVTDATDGVSRQKIAYFVGKCLPTFLYVVKK